MKSRILASFLIAASIGCANTVAPKAPPPARAASGHGYALLYQILGQERQVSKLLVIKQERKALETVIDAISETSGAAYDRLGELAKQEPRIDLSDTGLPDAELRTREAMKVARRDQLLAASGPELEWQLLLAQNEALIYTATLTDTLARSESNPARLAFLRALWKDLTRLQGKVQALLRQRAGRPSNTKP